MMTPVFLFVGEPFLTDRQVRSLIDTITKQASGEVPLQSYRLSETSLGHVLAEARTLPFLAASQIFRIRDTGKMLKDDLQLFADYLENPPESTCLIFEAEEMSRKEPLFTLISEKGKVEIFAAQQNRNAGARLIEEKMRLFGKRIQPQARRRLEESAGDAPSFLDSILNQILTYAGDQEEITEAMVEQFEEKWVEINAFQLTDALGAKKTDRALYLLRELLGESGGDAVGLIGLLHWQFRRLWLGRLEMDQGAGTDVIQKRVRLSPKQAPFFLRQVRTYERPRIERAIEGLFQIDWALKSGRVQGEDALERWVVETTASETVKQ